MARIGIALGIAGIAMTILIAVLPIPMPETLRWFLIGIAIILFVVAIIIVVWPKNRRIPPRTRTENYSRESLEQGVQLDIAPEAAKEIPLVAEKGEAIGQIQINALAVQGATEHYIDSVLFDSKGKETVCWDSNLNRGVGGTFPPDHYTLRLSNESPLFEKRLTLKVTWKSYTKPTKNEVIYGAEISIRIDKL